MGARPNRSLLSSYKVNPIEWYTSDQIIPVGGFAEVKNGQQHSFRLVLPEVIVSKELTDLRNEDNGYRTEGFIELVTIGIARGNLLLRTE
uniref:Transposase n=1 Tax=Ascaris lumbricoides TaxID=6252 RepID=A0A0M3HLS2_ASCLU